MSLGPRSGDPSTRSSLGVPLRAVIAAVHPLDRRGEGLLHILGVPPFKLGLAISFSVSLSLLMVNLAHRSGYYEPPYLPKSIAERAVLLLLVAPIGEEMLFRGLLEGYLLLSLGTDLVAEVIAVVLPAVLFAAIHYVPYRGPSRLPEVGSGHSTICWPRGQLLQGLLRFPAAGGGDPLLLQPERHDDLKGEVGGQLVWGSLPEALPPPHLLQHLIQPAHQDGEGLLHSLSADYEGIVPGFPDPQEVRAHSTG